MDIKITRAMRREYTAKLRKKLAKMARNIKTIKKDLVCKTIVSKFLKSDADACIGMNVIAQEQSALKHYQKEYREYNVAYCILKGININVVERNAKRPLNIENVNRIVDAYNETMLRSVNK